MTSNDWPAPTRAELLYWAKDSGNDRLLPLLVRRLVLETNGGVEQIDFPGEGGVAEGGFDGVLLTKQSSLFVPKGVSVWELSVERSSQNKAEGDYIKRLAGPLGKPTSSVHYVALIAQPWTKRDDFIQSHKNDARWKSMSAINVDGLLTWLSKSPATSVWFAELRGTRLEGLQSGTTWWDKWARSTKSPLGAEAVLAGRQDAAVTLSDGVQSPGLTLVGSDGLPSDELRAFACASLATTKHRVGLMNTIICESRDSFRRLAATGLAAVAVVPDATWAQDLNQGSLLHVVAPAPIEREATLEMPRIDSQSLASQFEKQGFPFHEAQNLGHLGRRSLLALRRRLATQPSIHFPTWATGSVGVLPRRAVMVGRWHDDCEADREAVEEFLGSAGATLDDFLDRLAEEPDAPMAKVSAIWHSVYALDSMTLVAKYLTKRDLEAFEALVYRVLGEEDPAASLDPSEQWKAGLLGKQRRFSKSLRSGLAETLALIGVLDTDIVTGPGMTGQLWADRIVRGLVEPSATDDSGQRWRSLSDWASTLAEAAPTVFLDALEQSMRSQEFSALAFTDQDEGFLGPPPSIHIDLVWALETVAWSEAHFARAVVLLARLAAMDPGGRWSDRPAEVLGKIFSILRPRTSAKVDVRFAVLDRLRVQSPEVAWNLMLALLPSNASGGIIREGPTYRNWKTPSPTMTWGEYYSSLDEVVARVVDDAAKENTRWTTLVPYLAHLHETARQSLITALSGVASELAVAERDSVWEALRKLIAHHREYSDTDWALPEKDLESLSGLMSLYRPSEAAKRHRWLFEDGWVTLGDVKRRDDFSAYDLALDAARSQAAEELAIEGGANAVLAFALSVPTPGLVGKAAASLRKDLGKRALADGLKSEDRARLIFTMGYITAKFQTLGWTWIDQICNGSYMTTTAIARALRATYDVTGSLERLDRMSPGVRRTYWKEFSYFGLGQSFGHIPRVARELLEADRPAACLNFIHLYSRRRAADALEPEIIAAAFERLMVRSEEDQELQGLSAWDFSELLKMLGSHTEELGRGRVLSIEWYFFPTLGYDPDPTALHAALADEPEFFIEVMKLRIHGSLHRPGTDGEAEEARGRAASNASAVLKAWHGAPGVDADGAQDADILRAWVRAVRGLAEDTHDDQIQSAVSFELGRILADSGTESGEWPSAVACELLEELDEDLADRGLSSRLFNRRGVVSKSLLDGGSQERTLAGDFTAKAERVASWPRFSRVLSALADSYSSDSLREDAEAELRRRGLY